MAKRKAASWRAARVRAPWKAARRARDRREPARLLWIRLRQRASRFTAGGQWTDQLYPDVRHNLRWFWFDGLFASASDAVIVAYLSLFVLALGGTRGQIGLLSALSSLSAAFLLLPGAAIVERRGHCKQMVLLGGGGVSRVALLLLALTPLAFTGSAAVYVVIALAVVRSAFANLSLPAWTSLTADIVPLSWRGRYFSSRNVAMGVVGMVVTFLAGQMITAAGAPAGYQLALGLAFVVGLAATFSFARITEPLTSALPPVRDRNTRLPLMKDLRTNPTFLAFCSAAFVWNFSLNVAGPFFSVHMVENLKASARVVGALSVVNGLAALPGQRLFGMLTDRWGPRRIQLTTGLLIPLLPLGWALTRSPWHIVPINLASGFLWAGYELASFNFLLTLIPEDRRPRYSALYNIVVMGALAAGAAVGGVIAQRWGTVAVFVVSGIGRLAGALLFARFVRQPGRTPATSEPDDKSSEGS